MVNSQNKKEKIALLQNVGGFLRPGEMAALMGCAAACPAARPAAAHASSYCEAWLVRVTSHTHLYLPFHAASTPLCSPSGSGKTTLLDLLAGRKTVGQLEGAVAFAGNKPTPQFLRRFTGYVEQFGGCCCLVQLFGMCRAGCSTPHMQHPSILQPDTLCRCPASCLPLQTPCWTS